eukprot:CAMPEP_0118672506 /NCGR_PEP_ID=MMETSP0785-20121206/22577_1 /TAXON_ID=91992 /ORGANISM="Bolidomonas pacifica, Strain CCMP 1866" /LENGTH=527 /DNA_ID=CAMNT_0006567473 /DNA_START=29 /DNA_END=1613 /DNA_ORIENTATION=+
MSISLNQIPRKPIIYSIAGSDSGGGAGIQADLHTIRDMGGFGCTAVTALTAQNSVGVPGVHAPPPAFLRLQLDTLSSDLPFDAIKIGMLGDPATINTVGDWLDDVMKDGKKGRKVVLDPVMIATSGARLITEDCQDLLVSRIFKHADIVTPNVHEASALCGYPVNSGNVAKAASEILAMGGCGSVVVKGGHMDEGERIDNGVGRNDTIGVAGDYYLSKTDESTGRVCDCTGTTGVWLNGPRYDTSNTHGTGCSMSSAIATCMGVERVRIERIGGVKGGMLEGSGMDAVVAGKGYVARGIEGGVKIGHGPGPVGHFGAMQRRHMPWVGDMEEEGFKGVEGLDGGGKEVQLRYKGKGDVSGIIREAVEYCRGKDGVRLWINDFYEEAIEHGADGVHLGQEDLRGVMEKGGLKRMREKGILLGISTHCLSELGVAKSVRPSYISLGPVFGTTSKKVEFGMRGLEMVERWRELIDDDTKFMVIGGINDFEKGKLCKEKGADCVAVLGVVKNKTYEETEEVVKEWRREMFEV